ncbi:MAG: M23 family metallopeptidase [Saprospiraceae bacterium]|nr:M23 family metallopeptidase [Pyrinomonadaceae bacterium]
MAFIRVVLTSAMLVFAACSQADIQQIGPPATPVVIADSFAYPVGKTRFLTQAKDAKDEWYNALDFGEDNHLGEDWNKNSGGNTDCGEAVYSAANGIITYAKDAGPGWGNVVMIEHTMPDGRRLQSLYAHLQEIAKTTGEVRLREQIGKVGNANGRYLCHLHFEIRDESCPSWDMVFIGYSPVRTGWLDPSDLIDSRR